MGELAYQDAVSRLCLAPEPDARDLAALGGEGWRWLRYRRLVRGRLVSVASHGLSRLADELGAARFARLVGRFLAEAPPRSPLLREVGGELLAWLERDPRALVERGDLPAFGLDLARLAWAERRVADAENDLDEALVPLSPALRPALTRAFVVVRLEFDVHLAVGREPTRAEHLVLVHRDPGALDVRLLEVDALELALAEAMQTGDAPLDALVRDVCRERGVAFDATLTRSIDAWLAKLVERGIVRGSRPAGAE